MSFDRICNSGRFYEDLFGVKYLVDKERQGRKRDFFSFLFGKIMNCPQVYYAFKKKFPTILKYINKIKKENYRELARLLQKFESFAVIETIVRKIVEDRPEIPLFTIHDSIMTTEQYVPYVYSTIKTIFIKEFDMDITLKVE